MEVISLCMKPGMFLIERYFQLHIRILCQALNCFKLGCPEISGGDNSYWNLTILQNIKAFAEQPEPRIKNEGY